MNRIANKLAYIYSLLLRLYPGAFQDEFAAEMQGVFREAVNEATREGALALALVCLRELAELPLSLLREFWHERKGSRMVTSGGEKIYSERTGGASRQDALIAILPFVLFGLVSMLGKINPNSVMYLFLGVYLVTAAGLAIGIARGSPRWAYSWLGWSGVYLFWWMNVSLVGLIDRLNPALHNIRMGPISLLPILLAVGTGLLWRRSWQPLKRIFTGIWQDWTLLSFAIFTFGAFVFLIYDENHHPYLLLFMTASMLVLSASVWGYMRLASTGWRILSLIGGFAAAWAIQLISDSTWDYRTYYGLAVEPPEPLSSMVMETLAMFAFWILFMFWPVLIGLVRRSTKPRYS